MTRLSRATLEARLDLAIAALKRAGEPVGGIEVARARLLHEAGATQLQAKAWLAHLTDVEASHYGREADRRRAVMGTPPERQSEKPGAAGEKSLAKS